MSPGISPLASRSAYTPFTPSDSEQRLHPTYYRGCWHVVSRCFLYRYRHQSRLLTSTISSRSKAVYNPKAFIPHAASLGQTFVHCRRFSTAATRRCLGSVSVPVRRVMLSHPLPIIALVVRYTTNKLVGRGVLLRPKSLVRGHYSVLPAVSRSYPDPQGKLPRVTLPCAAVH